MSESAVALSDVFFLRDRDEETWESLWRLAFVHDYPKGNVLHYHGEPSDAVYIVLRGRVKVSLVSDEGREVTLGMMGPSAVFGLVAALDGGPHVGTAVTACESRLAKITRERFMGWLRERPDLQITLGTQLARMLRGAYEKVGEQALLSVKERLLATLIEIARAEGTPTDGGQVAFVRPTHQELADRVGTTRVVVSRAMKELLAEEGYLAQQGREIRVSVRFLSRGRDNF